MKARAAAGVSLEHVAAALRGWVIRYPQDRLLDPCAVDGSFLGRHGYGAAVGCPRPEDDSRVGVSWHPAGMAVFAASTAERFDAIVGNLAAASPRLAEPGAADLAAATLAHCRALGVAFDPEAPRWAMDLVLAVSLLRPGGRMALVVPGAIAHDPAAGVLLRHLVSRFERVQVIAVREPFCAVADAWMLYADGCGAQDSPCRDGGGRIGMTVLERFVPTHRPLSATGAISLRDWESWDCRLRPFLLPRPVLDYYRQVIGAQGAPRLGQVAQLSLGGGAGPYDCFHLRPSEAAAAGLATNLLYPVVRHAADLAECDGGSLTRAVVNRWWQRDEPNFLLWLRSEDGHDPAVAAFLSSGARAVARRTLEASAAGDSAGRPWYVLDAVAMPEAFFLAGVEGHAGDGVPGERAGAHGAAEAWGVRSVGGVGRGSRLIANAARCVCSGDVQAVQLLGGLSLARLQQAWQHPFTELSRELAGTPTAAGDLRLGPQEIGNIRLAMHPLRGRSESRLIQEGLAALRRWRTCRAA